MYQIQMHYKFGKSDISMVTPKGMMNSPFNREEAPNG